MTEHYSGHDPETGCGVLLATVLAIAIVVALVVVLAR